MHRCECVSENIRNMQEHAFPFVNPSWWWVLIFSGGGMVILVILCQFALNNNVTFLCTYILIVRPCNLIMKSQQYIA